MLSPVHSVRLPTRTCHICGMASWACSAEGFTTKITSKAANKFRRDRQVSVWCCSRSCAIQANALSEMGPATHKWPMTLAEYTIQYANRLDIREVGADRTETIAETRVNTGATETEDQIPDQEAKEAVSVREIARRRGGRPRRWKSEADRLRAYRGRKREESRTANLEFTSFSADCVPPTGPGDSCATAQRVWPLPACLRSVRCCY
jgi:hypothetical protein